MNKAITVFSSILAILLMANCYPKASEVIRALPIESKDQILAQYSQEQIVQGHTIFENNCANCHKLKQPQTRNALKWNKVIKKMIPRAKLSDEEGKLVRAYVIANSKDE